MGLEFHKSEKALVGQAKRSKALAFACIAAFLLASKLAPAFGETPSPTQLPTGGNVTSGAAGITTQGAQMNVNQSSQKAIINWNTFNVGSKAQVNFNQPSASSQTLNRVNSADPSQIYGKINANGQVFFVNPNGIVFGPGSQVNAASLVASTMDISDENFQLGNNEFQSNGAAGSITNKGTLTSASGGTVALVGSNVTNAGAINTPSGKAILAAGESARIPLTSSGLVSLDVSGGNSDAIVTNETSGTITATGGQIHMAAEAGNENAASVVNKGKITADQVQATSISGSVFANTGSSITARKINAAASMITGGGSFIAKGDQASVNLEAGYVSLSGETRADSAGGAVSITGKDAVLLSDKSVLSASGTTGGNISVISPQGYVLASGSMKAVGSTGKGGTIKVSGTTATALLGAKVDASGATGGGSVHIGGDLQGNGPLLNSASTTIDASASINADATRTGTGGDVVVWSTGSTSFFGNIYARGGPYGGDGGQIEVSSQGTINVQLSSSRGLSVVARKSGYKTGTVTMDPANVVIGDAVAPFTIFKALLNTSTGVTAATDPPTGTKASSSYFGFSTALNGDYALIGIADPNGSGYVPTMRGNAYLYNLNTGRWTDLSATPGQPITALTATANFGYSVALNSNYALIGATYASNHGNAWLYNLNTGAWTNLSSTTGQPISAMGTYAWFGSDVALNETYALLGAWGLVGGRGNAYLYNLNTGAWTNLASTAGQPISALGAYAYVGEALALNETYALISAHGASTYRGNAFLYNLTTGAWKNLATTPGQPITALPTYSHFGNAVALNSTYALIGAERVDTGSNGEEGTAYLYNLATGAWTNLVNTPGQPLTSVTYSSVGHSVAINSNYALLGLEDYPGTAFLYNLSTGAWTDIGSTPGSPVTQVYAYSGSTGFGRDVSLNENFALISGPYTASSRGGAWLYNLSSGEWTDLISTPGEPISVLQSTTSIGASVAINGSYALFGAPTTSTAKGTAYLYNLETSAWTDLATVTGQPITALSSYSNFGSSVSLSSRYALIGASGVSTQRGNAYLYNLTTGTWTDLSVTSGQPVTALSSNSKFGSSTALSGSYALIGAYGISTNRGGAYLYDLSSGTWTDLTATSGEPVTGLSSGSSFGYSVALNNTFALIGSPGPASGQGNAYLYNLADGTWTDLAATTGQPISSLSDASYFGNSVALNTTYALLGAKGVSATRGNAYLYNLYTGAWTDLAATAGQPITGLEDRSSFGVSVALNSTYALIGANGIAAFRGNAYLYNLSTGAWTDLAGTAGQPVTGLKIFSHFGASVALSADYALVGAPTAGTVFQGNAYLYDLSTGAWTNASYIASRPFTILSADSAFGASVALNSRYALIGAYHALEYNGGAYLYDLITGTWTDMAATVGQPITGLPSYLYFGYSVALNETYALMGGLYTENAWLYNLSTGAWTGLAASAGSMLVEGSHFGYAVALSNTYALIGAVYGGAQRQGDAYLYNLATGVWTDLATTPGEPISALAMYDAFGSRLALTDSYALIGAYGVSDDRGNAYLYNISTGEWTDLAATSGQPITALASWDQFGSAVALNDTYALLGTPGTDNGNAYLYDLSTGVWTDLSTTTGQPITALSWGDDFGSAVALNSTYALIGAENAGAGGNAYLYNLSTGAWTTLSTTTGQPITSLAYSSYFGHAVALNDTYALIGAYGVLNRGNAYLYKLTGGWKNLSSSQTVTVPASSAFGYSVALSNTYALIGARSYSSSRGNGYLYNLTTGTWIDLAATSGQPITSLSGSSYFGTSVALNSQYALIGATGIGTNRGNAYLYKIADGTWTNLSATSSEPITGLATASYFGASVALNNQYALIGAYGVSTNKGNAYLYYLSGGEWTTLSLTEGQPITGLANASYFGASVALNDTYALIGAYGVLTNRGNAFLYNLSGGWTTLSATANQPIIGLAASSRFGSSVALNDTYALIGAYGVSSSRGNAFLYNLSEGGWTNLGSTSGSPTGSLLANSYFGIALKLSDDYALIGASGIATNRGNAYLYSLAGGYWIDFAAITGQPITALASSSRFGFAVALNDDYALIGAYGVSSSRGQSYLISLPSVTSSFIDSDTIAAVLAGANYKIVADNNLTIKSLDLPSLYTSSSLTLEAGNSIDVLTNAVFGSRAVSLLANAPNSELGTIAYRVAGAGGITIESGASLDNGTGLLTLEIGTAPSTGRTGDYATAGDFTLDGNITSGSLLIDGASSGINVTSVLTAEGSGYAMTLNGLSQSFSEAGTLSTPNGNWIIYNETTGSLGTVALNGLVPDFNRYGCIYTSGCTTGAILPSDGNGVVYAFAPTLSVTLAQPDKVYDSTTAANVLGATINGIANGDIVSLTGSYSTKNVGNGLVISFALDTPYGYVVNATTGNITTRTLIIAPNSSSKIYDSVALENAVYSQDIANYTFTGFQGPDTAYNTGLILSGSMTFNGSTLTYVRDTGSYVLGVGTLTGADTYGNYQMAFANPANESYTVIWPNNAAITTQTNAILGGLSLDICGAEKIKVAGCCLHSITPGQSTSSLTLPTEPLYTAITID